MLLREAQQRCEDLPLLKAIVDGVVVEHIPSSLSIHYA